MAVDVPDCRQRYSYDCGPACAEAVAKAFGKKTPEVRCSTRTGATVEAMAEAMESVGLVVQTGRMDVGDLRHHLRRGRVVVCIVPVEGEGHYVVVSAVNRGKVTLHDPDGGPRREPLEAFLKKWRRADEWSLAAGLI